MRRLPFALGLLFVTCTAAWGEVRYEGVGKRDPFTDVAVSVSAQARPSVTADSIGKSLEVTGISYSEQNPKAIVNGRILGVGDAVGRLGRITRIERDGIAIQVAGQEFFFKQTLGKTNDTKTP